MNIGAAVKKEVKNVDLEIVAKIIIVFNSMKSR